MGLSALAMPLIGPLGATAILSSSFGNRLRIIAPLGTFNYISLASHKGVFIKDGRIFELVHTVDTILFDKTGTLTEERPKIGTISSCDQYSELDILKYAAAAESKLAHPIADAVVQAAKGRNLVLPEVDNSEYKVGYGITVKIGDKIIKVGSIRFIKSLDIEIPEKLEKSIHEAHKEGHSSILVVINNRVIGSLEVQTQVRPEVKEMIERLRKRGIKYMAIVSGDHQQPTEKLAKLLKMDNYFFDVLPEDKASIVEKLKKEGKVVAFIGDGINDAIAMKKAHVSISLSGATSLATDTAQIILLDGNLSHLDELFEIGEKLENNLRNSFMLTLIPGIFTVFGAFFLGFTLIQAILVSNIGLVLGLKNAMNPLKEIKELKKLNKKKIEYNAEKSETSSKSDNALT
jgi:Cu2+-exporting ATPase